ncbi:MAG: hypothetical protein N3A66_10400 [Planctomycetota bacterium]|nr:hypothetical protein [Planctomycetota bacterium]
MTVFPFRHGRRAASLLLPLLLVAPVGAAATLGGKPPEGFEETLGLGPDKIAKDYSVQQIAASAPANVFWPGDIVRFVLQFTNNTDRPLAAKGRVDLIRYGTRTDVADVFRQIFYKIEDIASLPLEVNLPANGWQDIEIPSRHPPRWQHSDRRNVSALVGNSGCQEKGRCWREREVLIPRQR